MPDGPDAVGSSDLGEETEDATEELLVIADVVRVDLEIGGIDEVGGLDDGAVERLLGGQGLEARTASLRTIRHEDEAEGGPLTPGEGEGGSLGALGLDGHELAYRGAVPHGEQDRATAVVSRHGEVGRDVLASDPERASLGAERMHLIAGTPENRLDERLGHATLRVEEIHAVRISLRPGDPDAFPQGWPGPFAVTD